MACSQFKYKFSWLHAWTEKIWNTYIFVENETMDGKIPPKQALKKWCVTVWTGFKWFWIRTRKIIAKAIMNLWIPKNFLTTMGFAAWIGYKKQGFTEIFTRRYGYVLGRHSGWQDKASQTRRPLLALLEVGTSEETDHLVNCSLYLLFIFKTW